MEPTMVMDLLSRDPVTHKFDPGFRLRSPTDLIDICRSLIRVEDNDFLLRDNYHEEVVQFSHRSVEEYLLGEKSYHKPPAPFLFSMRSANAALGETCIQFLLQFHRKLGMAGFKYASQYWVECIRLAKSPELEQMSLQLFDGGFVFGSWCHLRPAKMQTSLRHSDAVPLFYAAYFGADWVCKSLILQGANVEGTVSDGMTALAGAVHMHHSSTLRLLLTHGASVDIECAWGIHGTEVGPRITPLEYAICQSQSHGDTTSDLIHVILDARPKLRRNSAFISAAGLANSYVLRKFLAEGIDPDVPEKGLPDGKRALTVAATFGRVENVRLLLEHGAEVNRRMAPFPGLPADETALTIVVAASRYNDPHALGYARICSILLENGADVEPVLQQLASRRFDIAWGSPSYSPAMRIDIKWESDKLDKILTEHLRNSNMDQYRRFRSLIRPWYVPRGRNDDHERQHFWLIGWCIDQTIEYYSSEESDESDEASEGSVADEAIMDGKSSGCTQEDVVAERRIIDTGSDYVGQYQHYKPSSDIGE